MKHTLFIFAILTASIQTFAQSPRIKLNQITKDTVKGSVLISSPTDSGMVYSRDLFISYGVSDTVLILGGDTLAATSSIISSVLSDGVTITGDGTIGSELTADTSVLATLRALSDSLALVISSVTADNVTITGDGTVGSPLKVDTATVVSSVGRLLDSLVNVRTDLDLKQDQLNGTGFVKATGTTITYDNSTYLTSEVDGDASNELQTLSYNSSTNEITLSDGGGTEDLSNLDLVDSTRINATGDTAYYYQNGVLIGTGAIAGGGGGSGTVTSVDVSGGTTGLTTSGGPVTTSGTITLAGTLDVDNGGTGATSFTAGQMLKGNGTSAIQAASNLRENGDTVVVDKMLNVGINTSIATLPLHVYKGINGFLTRYEGQSGRYLNIGSDDSGQYWEFVGNATANRRLRYQGANDAGNEYMQIIYHFGEEYISFVIDDVERMRLVSGGNIGIGTSTPSYKLDVNGDVRADTYYYDVTSTLQSSSDSRLKQNITDMDNVLDKLKELKLVKYEWNDNMYKKLEGRTSQSKLGGTFEGMIAQQVESLFPQYVGEDADGYKTLSYVSFVIPLLKGFQEQQAIIDQQATLIEQLKSQIQLILSEIEQIKNN